MNAAKRASKTGRVTVHFEKETPMTEEDFRKALVKLGIKTNTTFPPGTSP